MRAVLSTYKYLQGNGKVKGRNEAPSPGRWWGGRAQATGAGPGLGAPGLAVGAALRGLGAPKGPVGGLAVVAGVPAQAQRKHLRVPTGWALPAGNRRDRNFRALWQRGEGGSCLDAPGRCRGGSGAAPAHNSGGQGPGFAPFARASRGGRPRGTRQDWGTPAPRPPLLPPT